MGKDDFLHIIGHGPCPGAKSETQISFGLPYKKKILITRAYRVEQFLWKECYDEYNRQKSIKIDLGPNHTEYFEQFCKDKPPEAEEEMEGRIHKYPLYCTTPITAWNHDGDVTMTFRKKYSITRPISECTEKFAP